MATSEHQVSSSNIMADTSKMKFAIAVSEWYYDEITAPMLNGALDVLQQAGVEAENILIKKVPGSFELVFAANYMTQNLDVDAVIVLGCVVRGETPHFDYVCQAVTQGVAELNTNGDVPVVFGLLTTESKQQAIDRSGGKLGNKGSECAEVALKMVDFTCSFSF
ncbi:MAG: 6,7-dimethyl-8-ribityllumazine synthase [Prevotellaceae bacterium]|jgi:6,7-dimethyl-8-ribityllumazine synthase|nr:6,7-dimethyl-8-ribityllumazine synthase [Prevotellaceae bacterium]